MLDEIVQGAPEGEYDVGWPLIRYLLADAQYRAQYATLLQQVIDGAFAADPLIAQMREDHELIAPYVVGPVETETYPFTNLTSLEEFNESVDGTGVDALAAHVKARHEAVKAALALE